MWIPYQVVSISECAQIWFKKKIDLSPFQAYRFNSISFSISFSFIEVLWEVWNLFLKLQLFVSIKLNGTWHIYLVMPG